MAKQAPGTERQGEIETGGNEARKREEVLKVRGKALHACFEFQQPEKVPQFPSSLSEQFVELVY